MRSILSRHYLGLVLGLLTLSTACGDNLTASTDAHGSDGSLGPDAAPGTPSVTSSFPLTGATAVPRNTPISATFSEPMDRATLSAATVMLTPDAGGATVVGDVLSTSTTVAFLPADLLAADTTYRVTIATGARSAAQIALPAPYAWTFHTGTTTQPTGVPVVLGASGNFVLLGKSGITNVPTSMIVGDIGVSPITSTAITGFPLTPDTSTQFATTPEVTGRVYAPDYATPTPGNLTTAVSDMETAFTAAAGRAPDVTELGAGMIGSITLGPGVYRWSSALLIPTSITLSGHATDVWIFQIAQDLTLATGTSIVLAGGALPRNIFWQVSGQLVVNTGAHLEGNVLSQTAALLDTGSSLNGRLLAQTLVTVRAAQITKPQ